MECGGWSPLRSSWSADYEIGGGSPHSIIRAPLLIAPTAMKVPGRFLLFAQCSRYTARVMSQALEECVSGS